MEWDYALKIFYMYFMTQKEDKRKQSNNNNKTRVLGFKSEMSFTGFHICTPAHQLVMLWEAMLEQVVNGGRVFGQCNLWLLPATRSTTWPLPCKQAAVTGS